jgi:hypothetical protein
VRGSRVDALHSLLTTLGGARVRDVHLPGYLETGFGGPQFVALSNTIYLDLGTGFLRLDAPHSDCFIELTMVDAMTSPPELEREDDEFMTASIGDLFFDSGGSHAITRIRYAVVGEPRADRAVVRCAEFRIGRGVCLFFDPMWLNGIRLGATGQYETWGPSERERSEGVQEFVWEPAGA